MISKQARLVLDSLKRDLVEYKKQAGIMDTMQRVYRRGSENRPPAQPSFGAALRGNLGIAANPHSQTPQWGNPTQAELMYRQLFPGG